MANFQEFWLVYCDAGPRGRFDSEEAAKLQAASLAQQDADLTYYVLHSECACKKATVQWMDAVDVPF